MADRTASRRPFLAAVAGLTAGLVLGALLGPAAHGEGRDRDADGTVSVLVAERTVPAGTHLATGTVTTARMPADRVTGSMVLPEHAARLVGERVLFTLREGDPVMWSHLAAGAPPAICDWVQAPRRRFPHRDE